MLPACTPQAQPGPAAWMGRYAALGLQEFHSILGCTQQLAIFFPFGKKKVLFFLYSRMYFFFRTHSQKMKLNPGKEAKQQTKGLDGSREEFYVSPGAG